MGATASIGSALIGGAANLFGSSMASKAQSKAAKQAAAVQMAMYNTSRADLEPYRHLGEQATSYIRNNLTDLIAPINMDQAALEKTPGYQFTLTQGLKSTQNSAAARGLGSSGAALKGASDFTTGLADKTYLDQFNVANTNKTNTWNRLLGASGEGMNAAGMTGQFGMGAANGTSNALMAAGNAQAGGIMGAANAISGAMNNIGGYYLMKDMYGGGRSGLGTTPGSGGLY